MFTARTCVVLGVAAAALFVCQSSACADYMSATVPLNGAIGGSNAGSVFAEAYAGPGGAVNGLSPGQVRLTFTINPLPVYTQSGTGFGFNEVSFNTDLKITPAQITGPNGWSATDTGAPAMPANHIWQVIAPSNNGASSSVALLFTGLGTQATLDHFLAKIQPELPNFNPPPLILQGSIIFKAPGFPGFATDNLVGDTVAGAPEPSTLALGVAGAAAAFMVTNRRRISWRSLLASRIGRA